MGGRQNKQKSFQTYIDIFDDCADTDDVFSVRSRRPDDCDVVPSQRLENEWVLVQNRRQLPPVGMESLSATPPFTPTFRQHDHDGTARSPSLDVYSPSSLDTNCTKHENDVRVKEKVDDVKRSEVNAGHNVTTESTGMTCADAFTRGIESLARIELSAVTDQSNVNACCTTPTTATNFSDMCDSNMSDDTPVISANGHDTGIKNGRQCNDKNSGLCGYLNKYKIGSRGSCKLFKKRWFVFFESNCKLLYYKSPLDITPLGQIDISCATFTVKPPDESNTTQFGYLFEISSLNKTCWLEAVDQQTMLYWLQELQSYRRRFNRQKADSTSFKSFSSGVLDGDVGTEHTTITPPVLLTCISMPEKTVGPSTSETDRRHSVLDISNWRAELRNVMANKRPSDDSKEMTSVGCESPQADHTKPILQVMSDHIVSLKQRIIRRQKTPLVNMDRPNCTGCKNLQQQLHAANADLSQTSDELVATHELLKLLHKQIDVQQTNLKTQLLSAVEQDLRRDVSACHDTIQYQDKTIETLTMRISELEVALGSSTTHTATNTVVSMLENTSELLQMDILQDRCNAYITQNAFLNQEILELAQLLKDERSRHEILQVELNEAEARYYQVKSKYLYCLKELSAPQTSHEEKYNTAMVDRLLEDAQEMDSNEHRVADKFDQYGFSLEPSHSDDLLSKASGLQRRADILNVKAKWYGQDVATAVRWERYMVIAAGRQLERSDELKILIRDGIPVQLRSKIWQMCIEFHVHQLRDCCGSSYYDNLLERVNKSQLMTPIARQIELDLLRTLPNNKYYNSEEADGVPRLRNVLLAFSIHNPDIGYCQGLNRLAAILLLFLEEEQSFWGLVAITESIMPRHYYDHTLLGAHVDQRVLKDIMATKLPELTAHFDSLHFDMSLFTFNWFFVIYVDNIPVDLYLRIWDTFLYEGCKVLFRYAVAIMKHCEATLRAICELADLNSFMRTIDAMLRDCHHITKIAFGEINPFSMRMIKTKRQYHLVNVQAEMAELDRLRQTLQRSVHSGTSCSDNEFASDDDG